MTKEEKDRARAVAQGKRSLGDVLAEMRAKAEADGPEMVDFFDATDAHFKEQAALLSVEPNPPGERQRQGEAWVKKLAEEET